MERTDRTVSRYRKKYRKKYGYQYFLTAAMLCLLLSGCKGKENPVVVLPGSTVDQRKNEEIPERDTSEESRRLAENCRDIYEKADRGNFPDSAAFVRALVERIGGQGYAAVDNENQNRTDMVHPEAVEEFCSAVETGKEAETTIISVMENGDFIRFDLTSLKGEVFVTRSVINWNRGTPAVGYKESFKAHSFVYSEEGWLFFEQYQPAGYDGAPGYTALRVKPLDEKCRELNRKYILPIGYGSNNMFLTDWREGDFGTLDFNDLYGLLYSQAFGIPSPYEPAYEGVWYRVPEEDFEGVILAFFDIDRQSLRSRTLYTAKDRVYEYRTRGFEDWGDSPNCPFPEVVRQQENADGTVTMTVHAVYPVKMLSRAFSHEVTVRPLPDGGFRYVSNHVIPSEENVEFSWYVERRREDRLEKPSGKTAL